MIVLIDRVFVLANPAPDSRTIKVQKYSVLCLINTCLCLFCLIKLVLLQEEDIEKLFQDKLQQIEVRFYAIFCENILFNIYYLR